MGVSLYVHKNGYHQNIAIQQNYPMNHAKSDVDVTIISKQKSIFPTCNQDRVTMAMVAILKKCSPTQHSAL